MRTLLLVLALTCSIAQIAAVPRDEIVKGTSIRTVIHNCAQGPRSAKLHHFSAVPQPELFMPSGIIGQGYDKTQAPWIAAKVDFANTVDEADKKFMVPGVIRCMHSMVFEIRIVVTSISKSGHRASYINTSESMCDVDPVSGTMCMNLYDRMYRLNTTVVSYLNMIELTRKTAEMIKLGVSLLKQARAVNVRLELIYNKPTGKYSIPNDCSSTGKWYPTEYETYKLICLNTTSTVVARITNETVIEQELTNFQRTVTPKLGTALFPDLKDQECYNNGTLLENGICECHGNFSGPGCRFPCPASLYANLTAEHCAVTNERRCVFSLKRYVTQCVPYNNAPWLDKFDSNIVSMNHLELLVTPSQFADVFFNYEAIFKIEIKELEQQASMQMTLYGGHETKFTLKHMCPVADHKTGCSWNPKHNCADDPGKNCSQVLQLPYFRNITVSFSFVRPGEQEDMESSFLPLVLGSKVVSTPEGPPDAPTEPKITNVTSNSAVILWTVARDTCSGIITGYEIRCIRLCGKGPAKNSGDVHQNCRVDDNFRAKWYGPVEDGQEFKVRVRTGVDSWSNYSKIFANHPSSRLIIGLPVPVFAAIMVAVIIGLLVAIGVAFLIGIRKYKRRFQNHCMEGLDQLERPPSDGNIHISQLHRFNVNSGDATKFATTPNDGQTMTTGTPAVFMSTDYYQSASGTKSSEDAQSVIMHSASTSSTGYQSDAWSLKEHPCIADTISLRSSTTEIDSRR